MAFAQYANKVQNGLITPYKAFLNNTDKVNVDVSLNSDGSISVSQPVVEPIVCPSEVVFDEPPVLEAQPELIETESVVCEEPTVEVKPKRKRKTQ
jgi:hypothetical protein